MRIFSEPEKSEVVLDDLEAFLEFSSVAQIPEVLWRERLAGFRERIQSSNVSIAEHREEMARQLLGSGFFGTREFLEIGTLLQTPAPTLPAGILDILQWENSWSSRSDTMFEKLRYTCLLVYLPREIFEQRNLDQLTSKFIYVDPAGEYLNSIVPTPPTEGKWLLIVAKNLGGSMKNYEEQVAFLESATKLVEPYSIHTAGPYRHAALGEMIAACGLIAKRWNTFFFNEFSIRCVRDSAQFMFTRSPVSPYPAYRYFRTPPFIRHESLCFSAVREVMPDKMISLTSHPPALFPLEETEKNLTRELESSEVRR